VHNLENFHDNDDELRRPIHKPPWMAVASRSLLALHAVSITDQRPIQNWHGQRIL